MMRVAIVGAGPNGLFAAERLIAHLAAGGGRADVTVFDPQPPGWGAGYRPDQPEWLRLNVNVAIVAADGGGAGRPSLGLPAFADWRRAHGETDPLDPFPPRALVGRYLIDCWRDLLTRLPPGVMLRHRAQRVTDLTPDHGAWLIEGTSYDEVLLCTGHAGDWPGALRHGWSGTPPLVPRVYPVDEWLSEARVPSGCTVVCRGAALTFIDAAVTLTQGRGGRFERDGYRASGAEPRRIVPVGRRGGFMQVKPDPGGPLRALDLRGPRDRGLQECAAAVGDVDRLLQVVWTTAAGYLALATDQPAELPPPGTVPTPSGDPVDGLRRSLQVALGRWAPGVEWALGQAWRDLYPAIVEAVGQHRVSASAWPGFAAAAAALEPIAFGPPPVNAAKLLALCEAGVVDAGHLAGEWTQAVAAADVVIDCVLPPPGLVAGQWPDTLAQRGALVRAAGRRGIAVGPDGACLTAAGEAVPGLSAVGRLTEDVVIGNDTLSRTLHPATGRWAQRVAAACAAQVVGAR
ncbi:MAG: FAD/NAD(P)-binding protein [Micropruina sp.]|nr:FAD/NAD(P)-binding protein [Micropruina sp.]